MTKKDFQRTFRVTALNETDIHGWCRSANLQGACIFSPLSSQYPAEVAQRLGQDLRLGALLTVRVALLTVRVVELHFHLHKVFPPHPLTSK